MQPENTATRHPAPTTHPPSGSYKILGSSNILGNPVGFFHSISTGVSQFFYEPARGLHSPRAFGSGVARGTSSLVQHSLFGVLNTTSLLLSSVSKGTRTYHDTAPCHPVFTPRTTHQASRRWLWHKRRKTRARGTDVTLSHNTHILPLARNPPRRPFPSCLRSIDDSAWAGFRNGATSMVRLPVQGYRDEVIHMRIQCATTTPEGRDTTPPVCV